MAKNGRLPRNHPGRSCCFDKEDTPQVAVAQRLAASLSVIERPLLANHGCSTRSPKGVRECNRAAPPGKPRLVWRVLVPFPRV